MDMETWMAAERRVGIGGVEGSESIGRAEGAESIGRAEEAGDVQDVGTVEGVEIRPAAGEADLAAVAAIHSASWQDAYKGVVPTAILASKTPESLLPGWRKTLSSHPGNLCVLVEGGRILGFCCAGPVVDSQKSAPARFEVFGLHVDPSCRRRRLGSLLLKDALSRASGPAIVWTLEELALSRRFYEREGGVEHTRAVWNCGGFGFREISYLWFGSAT